MNAPATTDVEYPAAPSQDREIRSLAIADQLLATAKDVLKPNVHPICLGASSILKSEDVASESRIEPLGARGERADQRDGIGYAPLKLV